MYRKFSTALILVLILTVGVSHSQELLDLTVKPVPDGEGLPYIVRNPNEAILVVHSSIPEMSFDSNMGIISVDNPDPGEFFVHLRPGTNIVSFKAKGYKLVQKRFYIPAKSYKEVNVQGIGAIAISKDKAEITLNYQPSNPREEIYGGLDDMLMKIDFSKGYVVFTPSPGKHTIKLYSLGRVWEKTWELEKNEKIEEEVNFAEARMGQVNIQAPGNLFITSEPTGATVILNDVEQGTTPYTQNDVQPGEYTIEIEKDLYLPDGRIIEVKSDTYSKEHFALTPNFGTVEINSKPSGAMVWIQGRQEGKTPFTRPKYPVGSFALRLIYEFYHEETDTFTIKPGDDFTNTYTLKPQFGEVQIGSAPEGAEVIIDGASRGKTPLVIDRLSSGTHVLQLSKEHYFDFEASIDIQDGVTFSENYTLKPNFGTLNLTTDPEGVEVYIDGDLIGAAPLKKHILSSGSYMLRLEKDLYETREIPLNVIIGEKYDIEESLLRKTGKLRVESDPPEAAIYVNGKTYGSTPNQINDLPTGDYEVRIVKDGYDIEVGKVVISHNETSEFKRTLGTKGTEAWKKRRNKARMLSLIPGAGQFSSSQYARGALYSGAFVGCLAMTFLAQQDHADAESVYDTEMAAYNDFGDQVTLDKHYANAQSAWDDMKSAEDRINMMLIAAGGVYALQFVDAWIWGGGARPVSMKPYSLLDGDGLKVGVKVRF